MKLLVTTQADEFIKPITDITHPLFKKFAALWNADFEVISNPSECCKRHGAGYANTDHYRILNIYDLYEHYDRVLYLDSDMIITNKCPNPFDFVPVDKIGVIYEDVGSRKEDRKRRITDIQNKFGSVNWHDGYPNVGTFLTSKMHRNIFKPINGEWWLNTGYDCSLLGYQIHNQGFRIKELSYMWNASDKIIKGRGG